MASVISGMEAGDDGAKTSNRKRQLELAAQTKRELAKMKDVGVEVMKIAQVRLCNLAVAAFTSPMKTTFEYY